MAIRTVVAICFMLRAERWYCPYLVLKLCSQIDFKKFDSLYALQKPWAWLTVFVKYNNFHIN
jgi:hypothetical protein